MCCSVKVPITLCLRCCARLIASTLRVAVLAEAGSAVLKTTCTKNSGEVLEVYWW